VCVCVCVCVLHLNNNSLKFPKVETEFKSYSDFKNSLLSAVGQPTFESRDCQRQLKCRMICIIQCNSYLWRKGLLRNGILYFYAEWL